MVAVQMDVKRGQFVENFMTGNSICIDENSNSVCLFCSHTILCIHVQLVFKYKWKAWLPIKSHYHSRCYPFNTCSFLFLKDILFSW